MHFGNKVINSVSSFQFQLTPEIILTFLVTKNPAAFPWLVLCLTFYTENMKCVISVISSDLLQNVCTYFEKSSGGYFF